MSDMGSRKLTARPSSPLVARPAPTGIDLPQMARLARARGRRAALVAVVVVCLAFAVAALRVRAWPPWDCTRVLGQWGYGEMRWGEVQAGLLFYNMGCDLLIADLSEPSAPRVIRRLNLEENNRDRIPLAIPCDIALRGELAYVPNSMFDLLTIDISDPAHADVVGEVKLSSWSSFVTTVELVGDYLLAGSAGELGVFELSDPLVPHLVLHLPWAACKIAHTGNIACLSGADALRIVDFSDPTNPQLISSLPLGCFELTLRGDYGYLASLSGMHIVDLSDPAHPVEVSHVPTPSPTYKVALNGSFAYLAETSSSGGLRVVDVSDPASPVEVDVYDPPGRVCWVTLGGPWAYVQTTFSGLRVLDVSDPAHPVEVGTYTEPRAIGAVEAVGDYVLAADWGAGLRVLDASDPEAIEQVAVISVVNGCDDIEVEDGLAAVWCDHHLLMFDIDNPAEPALLSQLPVSAGWLALEGGYLYSVVDCYFRIFDVSHTAEPQLVTEMELHHPQDPGWIARGYGIAARWPHVFVVGQAFYGPAIMIVVDVSDPTAPDEVGGLDPYGYWSAMGIDVSGDYAYVGMSSSGSPEGIAVIDIANPAKPRLVRVIPPSFNAVRLKVAGRRLFVAQALDGLNQGLLMVYDLADPADPEYVGSYMTLWEAWDVDVADNRAYIADGYAGVQVIDVTDCQRLLFDGFETGDTSAWTTASPWGYPWGWSPCRAKRAGRRHGHHGRRITDHGAEQPQRSTGTMRRCGRAGSNAVATRLMPTAPAESQTPPPGVARASVLSTSRPGSGNGQGPGVGSAVVKAVGEDDIKRGHGLGALVDLSEPTAVPLSSNVLDLRIVNKISVLGPGEELDVVGICLAHRVESDALLDQGALVRGEGDLDPVAAAPGHVAVEVDRTVVVHHLSHRHLHGLADPARLDANQRLHVSGRSRSVDCNVNRDVGGYRLPSQELRLIGADGPCVLQAIVAREGGPGGLIDPVAHGPPRNLVVITVVNGDHCQGVWISVDHAAHHGPRGAAAPSPGGREVLDDNHPLRTDDGARRQGNGSQRYCSPQYSSHGPVLLATRSFMYEPDGAGRPGRRSTKTPAIHPLIHAC
jgi:hypothetical protein